MELSTIEKLPATFEQPLLLMRFHGDLAQTPTVIKQAAHWGSVSARVDTTSA